MKENNKKDRINKTKKKERTEIRGKNRRNSVNKTILVITIKKKALFSSEC